MIDFLETYYKLLSGIIVPIIVAIIGILKVEAGFKKTPIKFAELYGKLKFTA